MVDINQWRASIGGWNYSRTSCGVSNNKVKTNPTITDSVTILVGPATLSLILVLLLLVLSGDIEPNPGPEYPKLSDVFRFLKPHSARWDDIGRALNVDLNTRRTISQQGPTTSFERKLEEVIDHWIQSNCSQVSWDNLIKVLQYELQIMDAAEKLEDCLLNDVKMKEKYKWKKGHTNFQSSSMMVDQHLASCTSNSSQLPECVQAFRRRYKGYYARTRMPTHHKKPSPSITEFIQLILVHQKEKTKESKEDKLALLKHKNEGDTEEIKKKLHVLCIDELGEINKPQVLVLIKGDPGVGKSTLAWELCKGWTEGRLLQTWDVVLLVQLRAKNIREANTLQSLINPYNTHEGLCEYIQHNNGAGLMLIFDGFDELSDTHRQDSSFFMRLLRGEMLTEASIILTTRPSAMNLIPYEFFENLDQKIEIHGFDENAIHCYIESKFQDNPNILEAFKAYVLSHHFIFSLMYVPLHCALITDLYEHYCVVDSNHQFAPKTLTELYTSLICCLIWRNIGQKIRSISELSDELKDKFIELARIAAMGIENKQYIFDDIDADLDQFSLLQRVEIATEYYSTSESFSFLHLTLQEYLAAYYWSTLEDVSDVFNSEVILRPITLYGSIYYYYSSHWPVLYFYSGLTGITGTPLEPIVTSSDLGLGDGDKEKYMKRDIDFLCLLFESGNLTIQSTAFANILIPVIRLNDIESSKAAYVTGYCIARANTSVKWIIKMRKSSFMKNLVNGVEYGHLQNLQNSIHGSTIQEIVVENSSKDCDILQFFGYLEEISKFLFNQLKLKFTIDNSLELASQNSLVTSYTYDLTEFTCSTKEDSSVHVSHFVERKCFTKAILTLLEHFKSTLRVISLRGQFTSCITETTVDEHGQVHLFVNDNDIGTSEYCFPGPSLSEVNQSLSYDPCFIPYVVVQLDNEKLDFAYSPHGYNLLHYNIQDIFYSNKFFVCAKGSSVRGHDKKSLKLFDFQYWPLFAGRNVYVIYFYDVTENRWTTLKFMSNSHNDIGILVTPENVNLLTNILDQSKMEFMELYIVGDSHYLQPFVQFKNDLKVSILNQPQLAIILEATRSCMDHVIIEPEFKKPDNELIIVWTISCDLDQFHLVEQQFSLIELISFTIHGSPLSYSGKHLHSDPVVPPDDGYIVDSKKFHNLLRTILVSQSPRLKELKLEKWSPTDDDAKVIRDGLVSNHGLEVIVFDGVLSGLELLYEGLMNHKTLKTLMIFWCRVTSVDTLLPVVHSARSLKYLYLGDFSIDNYQSLLLGVAHSGIEEVAICERDEDLVLKILVDVLPTLLHSIDYKLIFFHVLQEKQIKHVLQTIPLGDTSKLAFQKYNELLGSLPHVKLSFRGYTHMTRSGNPIQCCCM